MVMDTSANMLAAGKAVHFKCFVFLVYMKHLVLKDALGLGNDERTNWDNVNLMET